MQIKFCLISLDFRNGMLYMTGTNFQVIRVFSLSTHMIKLNKKKLKN